MKATKYFVYLDGDDRYDWFDDEADAIVYAQKNGNKNTRIEKVEGELSDDGFDFDYEETDKIPVEFSMELPEEEPIEVVDDNDFEQDFPDIPEVESSDDIDYDAMAKQYADDQLVDPYDADEFDGHEDFDVKEALDKLEENESEVECKCCFDLFPKEECIKTDHGYLCKKCNQELQSHQGTNLDLIDANPKDLDYDDPRLPEEKEEPEVKEEPLDANEVRKHEAGITEAVDPQIDEIIKSWGTNEALTEDADQKLKLYAIFNDGNEVGELIAANEEDAVDRCYNGAFGISNSDDMFDAELVEDPERIAEYEKTWKVKLYNLEEIAEREADWEDEDTFDALDKLNADTKKTYSYTCSPSGLGGAVDATSEKEARRKVEEILAAAGVYVPDERIKFNELEEELKVITDFSDYKPWSGAVDTYELIEDANKLDDLEAYLEECYPDGLTVTQINDILWFDADQVLSYLGLGDSEDEDESEDNVEELPDTAKTEGLEEHVNDRPADIESDQKLQGVNNAVVDCKKYTLVAHSEDEKPIDCKLEKPALEEPLAGKKVDTKLYEGAANLKQAIIDRYNKAVSIHYDELKDQEDEETADEWRDNWYSIVDIPDITAEDYVVVFNKPINDDDRELVAEYLIDDSFYDLHPGENKVDYTTGGDENMTVLRSALNENLTESLRGFAKKFYQDYLDKGYKFIFKDSEDEYGPVDDLTTCLECQEGMVEYKGKFDEIYKKVDDFKKIVTIYTDTTTDSLMCSLNTKTDKPLQEAKKDTNVKVDHPTTHVELKINGATSYIGLHPTVEAAKEKVNKLIELAKKRGHTDDEIEVIWYEHNFENESLQEAKKDEEDKEEAKYAPFYYIYDYGGWYLCSAYKNTDETECVTMHRSNFFYEKRKYTGKIFNSFEEVIQDVLDNNELYLHLTDPDFMSFGGRRAGAVAAVKLNSKGNGWERCDMIFDRKGKKLVQVPVTESLNEAKKDEDEIPPDPEVVKLEVHQELNNLVADEIEAIDGYEEVKADIVDKPIEHKDEIIDTINHIEGEEKEHIDELVSVTTEIPFEGGHEKPAPTPVEEPTPVIEEPVVEEDLAESATDTPSDGKVKVGDSILIINMEGEPDYCGRKGKVEHIDGIGQLHGTWGGLAIDPSIDKFDIITDESLKEDIDDEDEVKCGWCGEKFPESECRHEKDFGYLCPQCEAELKSRGEELVFIENENLEEASSAETRAFKNGGKDLDDLIQGKAIARIKDPKARAAAVAAAKAGRPDAVKAFTGDRKENQAATAYEKKAQAMADAGVKDNAINNKDTNKDTITDIDVSNLLKGW